MDIETRLTNVEEDVDTLKVQCAVAHAQQVTKADIQEVKIELKAEIHDAKLEFQSATSAVKSELHAVEVRLERSMHTLTWRLLGGMFAMLTATVTIVYYMTS